MKFIYYLTCIGKPSLNKKLFILYKNLLYIKNNIQQNFSIVVNCYSDHQIINKFLSKFDFLDNIFIHYKEGILTEVWLTNPYNNKLNDYDYILYILDDVAITNININKLINIKNKYKLQLLSPKVKGSTFNYMNSYKELTINNAIEVYCLLLTPDDFKLFSSKHTIDNKWMWGVDLLFGYWGMNVGVYHKNEVIHCLDSKSDKKIAIKLGHEYIRKYGFNSFDDIEKFYKYVIKEIVVD
tara:strand:- start:1710 stop:2426 length:717 start_codon:yes stop_codon:yes gene_type:complete